MQNIILSFLTSLLVLLFVIPSIITVAKLKGLYDKPDFRKLHTSKIPRLGGLAIIAGFSIAVSLWGIAQGIETRLQYLQAALIILFFSGLKDDIVILSPYKKLVAQITATVITVAGEGILINNFHGLFGIETIPVWASYALTVFTIIVVTNSFNLIDGVDGLAGGIGFITAVTFGIWFNFIDQTGWSILAFGLAGALFAFSKGSISPDSLGVHRSIDGLVMVLLGGVQNLLGPWVGAITYTWLQDWVIRNTAYWRALLGSIMLILVLVFPMGIAGSLQLWWEKLKPILVKKT